MNAFVLNEDNREGLQQKKRGNMFWQPLLLVALLLLLGVSNTALPTASSDGQMQQVAAGEVPEGFSAAEWQSIQGQIATAEYQFSSVAGSWAASNRAQGWQTTFGTEGVQIQPTAGDWSWGLTLTGYGYGANLLSVANTTALTADKETITYQ